MSLLLGYQNIMTEKGLQIETQPHLEGPEENRKEFAKVRRWEWGPHRDWLYMRTFRGQVPAP